MEQFTVKLAGHQLTIVPCHDGSGFEIFINESYKGKIYAAEDINAGVNWTTDDDIDPHLVELVGGLIDEKEI